MPGDTQKVDLSHPFYDRLHKYLERLNRSSLGEKVIISTALIEALLEDLIRKKLPVSRANKVLFEGAYAPLSGLSAKIDLSYGLGLIWETEYKDLHRLRKVRNVVAHQFDFDLSDAKVQKLVTDMSWGMGAVDKLPTGHVSRVDDPQQRFEMVMSSLVMGLYGRESSLKKLGDLPLPALEVASEAYQKAKG